MTRPLKIYLGFCAVVVVGLPVVEHIINKKADAAAEEVRKKNEAKADIIAATQAARTVLKKIEAGDYIGQPNAQVLNDLEFFKMTNRL